MHFWSAEPANWDGQTANWALTGRPMSAFTDVFAVLALRALFHLHLLSWHDAHYQYHQTTQNEIPSTVI